MGLARMGLIFLIQRFSNNKIVFKIFKRCALILLLCFLGLSCSSLSILPSFLHKKSYSKNETSSFYRGPSSSKTQEEFSPLDLKALDSTKPTVCSMTLSSKDEREVFKKHLGGSFNFVELVNPTDTEWLKTGCESQIQCDILVVSGYFAGSFFGSSGRLSIETLNNRSCRRSCKGFFESPKEVFLFGSHTMAGEQPDSRSMQEYADILHNEHPGVFTKLMAKETAAYRYSPLGTQTQDRMKKIFRNARIYGFHSIAPSGKHISPKLHKYFKSIHGDYRSHLKKFPTEEENTFWSEAMEGLHVRSANGDENGDEYSESCILFSYQPLSEQLSWIDSVFASQNFLTYALDISEYLYSIEMMFGPYGLNWPKNNQVLVEHLRLHKRAKAKIGAFLEEPIEGLLAIQLNLLGLGFMLDWYSSSERRVIQKRLLGDLFSTNLTLEQRDLVCSLGNIQIDLTLEDLPQEKWNVYTIRALWCVRTSEEVLEVLIKESFDLIKSANENIHKKMLNLNDDASVKEKSDRALKLIKPPE